ncbi:MAG: multiheme c-type cytochrome [Nitrospiraceae bacterium]
MATELGSDERSGRTRVRTRAALLLAVLCVAAVAVTVWHDRALADKQESPASAGAAGSAGPVGWIDEIEKIFIRSEDCKQCHDRHYEEWKGAREQTPDLKTFGRVDAALLHGTAMESPVFRTVMGLWLQTKPSTEERTKCLSCHVPSTTVYPQHTEKIVSQIQSGKVEIEGIGCASCHLIGSIDQKGGPPPTFRINPGPTMHGPYSDPEENLVHPAVQSDLYRGANFCASCHFDKVKDVTRKDLPGEILQGTICQDCHMEPSTGSSTSKRGSMTRSIGRHWFRGVVVPGTLLKNRNLQAEWMPRIDIDVTKAESGAKAMDGTLLVRVGSLPHSFPDGDPVLKQFTLEVSVKDAKGRTLSQERHDFGQPYEQLMRGAIPEPFIKGGTTRKVPFTASWTSGDAATVEALLTYRLIPVPSAALRDGYLASLPNDEARKQATSIINDYTQPRVLTYRVKNLEKN